MGIKGTVKRSTDGDFIHANVDIDLIIDEEKPYGNPDKPVEIFHMIEHFCLGRRRLHLFGRDSTIRPGWLTVSPDLTSSNFDPEILSSYFNKDALGHLTGCTEEIERLRPKSPPLSKTGQQGGRGRGRGARGGNRGGPMNRRGAPRGGQQKSGWSGRGGPSRGGYGRGRGNKGGMPPRG